MINWNEKTQTFHLQNDSISYVLGKVRISRSFLPKLTR